MNKKVKSFTMDEEPYEALFKMFKENYVGVSISYFLNKAIKELVVYLQGIQSELNRSPELKVPMPYIIETVVREPLYKYLDEELSEGMTESLLKREARELKRKYDLHIGKNPDQEANYDINKIDKNVPYSEVIKYITDGVINEIAKRGMLTDEYAENARVSGKKGVLKKIREDVGPALDKFEHPINELVKKIKASGKGKNKEGQQNMNKGENHD